MLFRMRMTALRQQPPFANRMLFSAKATWAKDSHELRSPSLHHPISAQSSLLTDDYGGDSEALMSDMTEQCRHSCCDHYPLVRNRRRCPEDKWLLDVKRGHQVLFLRLFTKKLVSDPMIFFGWKPPSEATRSPLDRRETCPGSFGRLRQRHRGGFHLPPAGGEPPANDVEGRREDQSESRNPDHARKNRGAERLPELGSGAGRPNQWHDTENEGERRHQDRPQPQPRGFHGRGPAVTAAVLELLGEFDDQDRILRRKTNQHDEADLGEDVVILSPQEHAGYRGNEAHRHDEDHRQRQGQALILSGQNQKYENHRQGEGKDRSIARPNLLEGDRCPFIGEAVGQRLGGKLVHGLDGLALRVAGGRCAVELSGGIEVVAGHAVGPGYVADGGKRAKRHGVPARIANPDLEDVLGI